MFEVPMERSWPQDEHLIGAFPDFRTRLAREDKNRFSLLQVLPVLFTAFICIIDHVWSCDFLHGCGTVGHAWMLRHDSILYYKRRRQVWEPERARRRPKAVFWRVLCNVSSPITIKENPLITVPVFSETAGPICKVGIPIESLWHGEKHDVFNLWILQSCSREWPGGTLV